MYTGELRPSDPVLLLRVMFVADKYEVVGCLSYCCQLLMSLPMTTESALLYLDSDCSAPMSDALQPVKTAAQDFLVDKYKNLFTSHSEVMNMALSGVKAIFSSNELQVPSEDHVLDFLMKWADVNYLESEERCKIFRSSLLPMVRFNQMSCRKLLRFLSCQDLSYHQRASTVIAALLYKFDSSNREHFVASLKWSYVERAYEFRPIKVIDFERPNKQCIAYLDLKYEECANLFPSGEIRSQTFHFAGHWFYLLACCNMDHQLAIHCLGLFVGVQKSGPMPVNADIEFAARMKPAGDFVFRYKLNSTFTGNGDPPVGYTNVLNMPWNQFIAETSQFYVDGMLHLRAQFTVRQP